MGETQTVWFTSDQHYNHLGIIEMMKRPFSSVSEMNEGLIERHNEVVQAGDRVYHLGNFAWHNPTGLLERLNGGHYAIKGNHDKFIHKLPFVWVKDVKMLRLDNHRIFLSHYPHRVWPQSYYGSWHLHGHTRDTLPSLGFSTDVGVDAWDYYPVCLEQLDDFFKKSNPEGAFTHHHPAIEESE